MARKTAARCRGAEHGAAETSLSLDVGRAGVERLTGDGHGATCRALDRHAPSAPGAAHDVRVEGAAQEGGPIHAGKARVKAVIDPAMPERATLATTRADEAR